MTTTPGIFSQPSQESTPIDDDGGSFHHRIESSTVPGRRDRPVWKLRVMTVKQTVVQWSCTNKRPALSSVREVPLKYLNLEQGINPRANFNLLANDGDPRD